MMAKAILGRDCTTTQIRTTRKGQIYMSSVNKAVAPRKLRVTVTVEEFDPPKSNETSSSKELWASVGGALKRQIIEYSTENLRRLFWWLL
jgi:hypothetical protein